MRGTLKSGLFLSGDEPMTLAPSVKNDLRTVFCVTTFANGNNDDDVRYKEQARRARTLMSIFW